MRAHRDGCLEPLAQGAWRTIVEFFRAKAKESTLSILGASNFSSGFVFPAFHAASFMEIPWRRRKPYQSSIHPPLPHEASYAT
jgi:hypothetical protein